jgi:hypothetical protein
VVKAGNRERGNKGTRDQETGNEGTGNRERGNKGTREQGTREQGIREQGTREQGIREQGRRGLDCWGLLGPKIPLLAATLAPGCGDLQDFYGFGVGKADGNASGPVSGGEGALLLSGDD